MKLNASYLIQFVLMLPSVAAFQVAHRSFLSERRNFGFHPLPQCEVSTVSKTFTAPRYSSTSNFIDKEDQVTHTAERLAGISRAEVMHIFDDLDADGK